MAVATLIGDLISSRGMADRAGVHTRIAAAVAGINEAFDPVTPLRITLGDEYQGAFERVGDAVRATLRLRLALAPELDVRHGVGWGEVAVLADEPRVEDGPGWWAARDAIEAVAEAESRPGSRFRRTSYRRAEHTAGPEPAMVEAVLVLRDQMVGGLSERGLSVLRGLLSGATQREIATTLGISPSAVSQRIRADGLAALVAADEWMEQVS